MPDESEQLDIPSSWEQVDFAALHGILLVIGATDVGKSTLARFLFRRIQAEQGGHVFFLDGDPGQSSLGPPTTLTLVSDPGAEPSRPAGKIWRYFIGSTSPRGHMLSVLVGAERLVQAASSAGARTVIYDTSGYISSTHGGMALKTAKIDLLRPSIIFAIQHEQELESLLIPFRQSERTKIVNLRPSPAARRRDRSVRRSHRARQFARHFRNSQMLVVDWTELAVFPFPRFRHNLLVALEDQEGFTIGLGIVKGIEREQHQVLLKTPLSSLKGVNALRLGDLIVDPETYQDISSEE